MTQLITKKKEESMDEISVFFAKARVCLDEQEVKLKADLGDRFETITSEATSKGKIRVKNDRRQEFS